MKKVIAAVLVILLFLSGCAAPAATSSETSSDTSQNVSSNIQSSSETSHTVSQNITVVSQPSNVGTENTVSGSQLPSNALPLETDTWCYDRITKEQQRIYKILLSSANRMAYGWIDLGKCNVETYNEDIAVAYRAFTYDYPELFWVPYEYIVKREESYVKLAFSLNEADIKQGYLVNLSTKKTMQEELEAATEKIVSEIKAKTQDPMEQLTLLHDKLCADVTYYGTENNNDLVYTVYGPLVAGYAVCEGYARSMRYLCRELGIECLIVTGSSKNEQHMWNLVRFENEWYHIDATWDDAGGVNRPLHTYFNVTDEVILKDHIIDPDITEVSGAAEDLGSLGFNIGLPKKATGEKYNYYEYNGLNFSDIPMAAQKIAGIYKTQNFIELRLSDKEKEKYEKDISSFLGALIANVRMLSDENDFTIKLYACAENTLYLEW